MISLKYFRKDEQIDRWKEMMEKSAVKFELIEDEEINSPVLIMGNSETIEAHRIDSYMIALDEELEQWRVLECDRYYFDEDG